MNLQIEKKETLKNGASSLENFAKKRDANENFNFQSEDYQIIL